MGSQGDVSSYQITQALGVVFSMNRTRNRATGTSPFQLMFNRAARGPMELEQSEFPRVEDVEDEEQNLEAMDEFEHTVVLDSARKNILKEQVVFFVLKSMHVFRFAVCRRSKLRRTMLADKYKPSSNRAKWFTCTTQEETKESAVGLLFM